MTCIYDGQIWLIALTLEVASGLAPSSSSARTAPTCPRDVAVHSAVCPYYTSQVPYTQCPTHAQISQPQNRKIHLESLRALQEACKKTLKYLEIPKISKNLVANYHANWWIMRTWRLFAFGVQPGLGRGLKDLRSKPSRQNRRVKTMSYKKMVAVHMNVKTDAIMVFIFLREILI